jgi:hypothetical protein
MAVARQRASAAGDAPLSGSKPEKGFTDNNAGASTDEKPMPSASKMLWAEQLRNYVGTGAGLGSEALTG